MYPPNPPNQYGGEQIPMVSTGNQHPSYNNRPYPQAQAPHSPSGGNPYGGPSQYAPISRIPSNPNQGGGGDMYPTYSAPQSMGHGQDYNDDAKSFTSQSYLTDQSNSYGPGQIIPTQQYAAPPPMPHNGFSYVQQPFSPGPRGPASPASPAPSDSWGILRNKTIKNRQQRTIPLQNGNLVADVAVSRGVTERVPHPGSKKGCDFERDEVEKVRYTACTCDPDEFMRNKYTLRQYLWGRKTELFIVMTMYNEDGGLLLRTLNAVIKNIDNLCKEKRWGPTGWKNVTVCIVADGRKVVNQRVLKVLQVMGVYADTVASSTFNGKDVQAHIYEYTSNTMVDEETGQPRQSPTPVQYIFCLKEQNKKKLNSHRWFFNAFSPLVKPNVCVLLDVGTKPTGNSIWELYRAFDKHPNVGGACGEIYADTGKWGKLLFNPLVAGQNFEYKMSNILDKPFESVFGLIAVLPGAFSAYRYAAVQNHPNGKGPLAEYFHGEHMNEPGQTASIFSRNKFLAEDRILAFEIVTKKNAKWRLQYVKSAKAGTDVPARVPEFISQRRRWLNGSIFASIHSLWSFWRIWTSGHNIIRKIFLQFLMVYNFVNLVFTWISISSYYLAFYFLMSSSTADAENDPFYGAGDEISRIFNQVYIGVLAIVLICSLGNRPQGSKWLYVGCIFLFAVCQGLLLYCAAWTVYLTVPKDKEGWSPSALLHNETFLSLALSLMSTYGLYLVSSIMYLEPWHMLTSFVQYLFLLPSYVNILLIYAFCNLHDVSWGTKGDNGAANLGAAKIIQKDGEAVVQIQIPNDKQMADLYDQARKDLTIPEKQVKEKRSEETKRSDADRNYRTNVLLLFFTTNIGLIIIFTSTIFTNWVKAHWVTDSNFNPYLTFIFYSVLALAGLRFIGCIIYLLLHILRQT